MSKRSPLLATIGIAAALICGSVPVPAVAAPAGTVTVAGQVYDDVNRNGTRDPGEAGFGGLTVRLFVNGNQPVADPSDPSRSLVAVTDSDGRYSWQAPPTEGSWQSYTVELESGPSGYESTVSADADDAGDFYWETSADLSAPGAADDSVDFPLAEKPAARGPVTFGGVVWDDLNRNGVRDDGEPGIPGLTVFARDADGNFVDDPDSQGILTATTSEDGSYEFTTLPYLDAGKFYTAYLASGPDGYTNTTGQTRDQDGGYARTGTVELTQEGASDLSVGFGFAKTTTVSVSGTVYADVNRDGKKGQFERGFAGLTLTIQDPDGHAVPDPATPGSDLTATTDKSGAYRFATLPSLPEAGKSYRVVLGKVPDGYESTSGLSPVGSGLARPTTADLTAGGASDAEVDFPLAHPGDPGSDGDWLVMPILHGDLLYPEIDTAANGAQALQLRAEIEGRSKSLEWNDLVVDHTDAIKETLPSQYTPSADYSFIGPPGSTVYRSREAGPVPNGSPWIGMATQSPTLDVFQPQHEFSFRLDAVTGYDGGAAPGDVVLWQGDAPKNGQTTFSTRKSLPQALVFGKGKHSHFNWSFTQPGIYCMAFSVQTQMPDGSRQSARGILTQIVGSQYDPTTIAPCGRHLAYPAQATKQVKPQTATAPIVSSGANAAFALALDGQQLHATYNEEPTYADGPSTADSIDDVILYARAGLNYPYRFVFGDRWTRNISWDTVQIGDSALDGDITWKIDSIRGPGDLLMKNAGEWAGQKFDTANGVMSQTLWAGSAGNSRTPTWEVSRPGKYCVAMSWTAKTAAGATVTDRHVLTLVADGPLDPNDYDPYYEDGGKDGPYAGAVWRAADHGALDKTCAQGGKPTSADEVPVPGGGDNPPVDDSAWNVPNWTKTDSGALVLNNGHIDIASTLDGSTLDTQVKDTTDDGQIHATHDGASWHDPAKTVLQLLPDAETHVPADDNYRFLGDAGKPVWIVNETQQEGLLWPGWSTETIPEAATQTGVTWSLDKMTGPGEFALYKGGQTLGSVDVLFNTRDGITSADSYVIPKHSHVHGSWAFSAEGTYCLGFTRSTTLADGTKASNDFTLAVAVGKVEVKKVDPGKCFTGGSSAVATSVSAGVVKQTYGRSAKLTVRVSPATATGAVSVVAGSRTVTANVSAGKATVTLPARSLKPGKHRVKVSYRGVAGKFTPSSTTAEVTVSKAPASVSASVKPSKVRRGKTVTVSVRMTATGVTPSGKVTVTVAGRSQTVKLGKHGTATVRITISKTAKPSRAKVSVTYRGDSLVSAKAKTLHVRITR